MSTFENIYLYTAGLDPDQAAQRIAAVVNGQLRHARGMVTVQRPMASTPDGVVAIQIGRNLDQQDAPSHEHPSVIDLYDICCDVWCDTDPAEFQQAEAAAIFDEIARALLWPGVLLHNDGVLISAWAPIIGRTDFPPGTTPDEEHQERWAPYANPG